MTIGERIKQARLAATPTQEEVAARKPGISQHELAARMGCTNQTISNIERGMYPPTSKILMAFERALGARIVK